MTTSAYQLWLKKREFKAPRPPSSPASKSTVSSSLAVSKELSQSASNCTQDARESSQSNSTKFHAVSAVETKQVAVKTVGRPSGTRKRPRSWFISREEALGDEHDSKVAGKGYVAGRKEKAAEDEVAEWKRLRSGNEDGMKTVALKLAHASKALRQSSVRKEIERSKWSSRVDGQTKVAVVEESDAKCATGDDSSLVELVQMGNVQKGKSGMMKRLGGVGLGTVKSAGQSTALMQQNKVVEKKHSSVESATRDSTTKRLRFDDDAEESDAVVEERELPSKNPMKKRRMMRTRMLDESQYWMAVDRFSHLT